MSKPVISEYRYHGIGHTDEENRIIDTISIDRLIDSQVEKSQKAFCKASDFAFYASGWQSWGFGGELEPGSFQKRYRPLVPQWKQYFTVAGKRPAGLKSRRLLVGSFIIYLRWNNAGRESYLVLASTGNAPRQTGEEAKALPPVSFYVDRKKRTITCTLSSEGKTWTNGELMAELSVFSAGDFFTLRDTVTRLYAPDFCRRFGRLDFLNMLPAVSPAAAESADTAHATAGSNGECTPSATKDGDSVASAPGGRQAPIRIGGWESWYNHYADINEALIQEDLAGLGSTDNLIKTLLLEEKKPCVFQVDDGWEEAVGDWDARSDRFPGGMKALASSIAEKGCIPGLWIAPLIVDWRSKLAQSHRDWILRNRKGKPIAAGMNLLWGAPFGREQPSLPYSYFCLDISRDDVLSYLDSLMERVINEWGFRYLKLDFLFAGLLAGSHKNGGAAYQWYEKALAVLTKRSVNSKGEPVAYLGCGMPFEASFRGLPLSRIGPDTKEAWDINWMRKANYTSRPSAFASLQSTLGHAFWNQAVFINDPDVVFLRYQNISLNDKEKLLIALVNVLFASQIMHSDDPVHFEAEKEGSFTARVAALYKKLSGVEFGLVNLSATGYRIFSRDGLWCGCINLGEESLCLPAAVLTAGADGSPASPGAGSLEPLVSYGVQEGDSYRFESHSISIYRKGQERGE